MSELDSEIPFDNHRREKLDITQFINKKEIADEILDEEFQTKLLAAIKENNLEINIKQAEEDSKKHLNDMFSTHEKISNTVFVKVFQFLIEMGYEKKVDVNNEELQKLTRLMQTNSVAFVSSHKSYLDLIIFFIMLSKYELPLPFIFSGANLRFPILGDISKKSGIIFYKKNY